MTNAHGHLQAKGGTKYLPWWVQNMFAAVRQHQKFPLQHEGCRLLRPPHCAPSDLTLRLQPYPQLCLQLQLQRLPFVGQKMLAATHQHVSWNLWSFFWVLHADQHAAKGCSAAAVATSCRLHMDCNHAWNQAKYYLISC